MNYLIDTNIFIIMLEKSYDRLSMAQRRIIADPKNKFYLSEASLFEIGIKVRLGKADFSHINIATIDNERKRMKIKLLKSKVAYYTNIPTVPKVLDYKGKPHGDPFDLLIISQALNANLPTISTDGFFPLYAGLVVIS